MPVQCPGGLLRPASCPAVMTRRPRQANGQVRLGPRRRQRLDELAIPGDRGDLACPRERDCLQHDAAETATGPPVWHMRVKPAPSWGGRNPLRQIGQRDELVQGWNFGELGCAACGTGWSAGRKPTRMLVGNHARDPEGRRVTWREPSEQSWQLLSASFPMDQRAPGRAPARSRSSESGQRHTRLRE